MFAYPLYGPPLEAPSAILEIHNDALPSGVSPYARVHCELSRGRGGLKWGVVVSRNTSYITVVVPPMVNCGMRPPQRSPFPRGQGQYYRHPGAPQAVRPQGVIVRSTCLLPIGYRR